MFISKLSMALLLSVSALTAYANECSESQQRQAEQMQLNKWEDVYTYFKKYKQCDDAQAAEVTSEEITHVMATNWSDLKKFEMFVRKNPSFKSFVFDHINEMADYEDVEQIVTLSQNQCRSVSKSLCNEIYQASLPIKIAQTPTK